MGRVSIVMAHIRGLMTPLAPTHEPPSWGGLQLVGFLVGLCRDYLLLGLLRKWEAESISCPAGGGRTRANHHDTIERGSKL